MRRFRFVETEQEVTRALLPALLGATLPLDYALPARDVALATDQVASARDHAGRVAAFEAFLGGGAGP